MMKVRSFSFIVFAMAMTSIAGDFLKGTKTLFPQADAVKKAVKGKKGATSTPTAPPSGIPEEPVCSSTACTNLAADLTTRIGFGDSPGVRNLEYLGIGYDFLRGNPRGSFSSELDPGTMLVV